MLQANAKAIVPCPLRSGEMAQVLAALFAQEEAVAAMVARLAPRSAAPILAELCLLASGAVAPEEISAALRWILPEIHEELGRRFPATRA